MPSPIPYIVLFVIITVVALACLVKFSSLRKYRKKRNLLVYGVVALLLSLTGYQSVNVAYQASMGTMMITYDVEFHRAPLYAGQTSQFTVSCEVLGRQETSFYLVLNGENASLTADTQEYVQMNGTAIKIPFTLNSPHQEVTKIVHFKINENVTSCRIQTDTEPIQPSNHGPIVTGATDHIDCILNPRTNSYTFTDSPGPCV